MAFFWDHNVSNRIRDLGYDVTTQTLAVVFPGRRTVYHSPVPYTVYASIFHAKFPEKVYRDIVERVIPVIRGVPRAS